MKQLLIDSWNTLDASSIDEGVRRKDGKLIISGVIQRAESLNQNGRKYPRNVLDREVEKYKKVQIAERRAYGELDHPDRSVVEFKTSCLNMLDLWWEGNDLCGSMEILTNLPCGKIVEGVLQHNLKIGISSRGLGSVKQLGEGTVEVEDDFEIVCWDIVTNPSTHGAFMEVVTEGKTDVLHTAQNRLIRIDSLINDIIAL